MKPPTPLRPQAALNGAASWRVFEAEISSRKKAKIIRKSIFCVTLCAVLIFATPAFSGTHPFMDVPLNHWSTDAIAQLAARGVLSGYPDGLYRGKQPVTRYEMASALARSLALADMSKANKQDVEMLKKLVVEFKDELDALGVKTDLIDKRVGVLEERLGGWAISGELRFTLQNYSVDGDGEGAGDRGLSELTWARLYFDRKFGPDESLSFHARLTDEEGSAVLELFYVDIPVFWDSTLTVGRFEWDLEANYYLAGVNAYSDLMEFGQDSWLTDRVLDGLGWSKSFNLGKVTAYATRTDLKEFGFLADLPEDEISDTELSSWEFFLMGELQFTEKFALDLGIHSFWGDDASTAFNNSGESVFKVDNLWTAFAGIRVDFTEVIGLRGMYYYQDSDLTAWKNSAEIDLDSDSPTAFRIHLDIGQDLLKFTSLWLEYNRLEQGFVLPTGEDALWGALFDNGGETANTPNRVDHDLEIWRFAAQQEWNERWTTFLYYSSHTYENAVLNSSGGNADAKADVWGVGAVYIFNPQVTFGLGLGMRDWNSAAEFSGLRDETVVRFRTQIAF